MSRTLRFVVMALSVSLAACGTRTSTSVDAPSGAVAARPATIASERDPSAISVLETDIADRKYHSLGDISVTVSKNTIFDSDPTQAQVNDALRKRAAKLGADAVILVRYGTVGMGVFTWGKLDGNGRAIAFDN